MGITTIICEVLVKIIVLLKGALIIEEEMIFEIDDDFIPQSSLEELPETRGVPLGCYFAFGILLMTLGVNLRRIRIHGNS